MSKRHRVHRDVKSSRTIVTAQGEFLLRSPWGYIAKAPEDTATLTDKWVRHTSNTTTQTPDRRQAHPHNGQHRIPSHPCQVCTHASSGDACMAAHLFPHGVIVALWATYPRCACLASPNGRCLLFGILKSNSFYCTKWPLSRGIFCKLDLRMSCLLFGILKKEFFIGIKTSTINHVLKILK